MAKVKKKPMTPKEFDEAVARVISMYDENDPEVCHGDTDYLMEDLLILLGYEAGVARIRESTRWRA